MLNLISSPLLNFFVMEIDKVDNEIKIAQIRDKITNPQHFCCGFDWRRRRDLNSRAG